MIIIDPLGALSERHIGKMFLEIVWINSRTTRTLSSQLLCSNLSRLSHGHPSPLASCPLTACCSTPLLMERSVAENEATTHCVSIGIIMIYCDTIL